MSYRTKWLALALIAGCGPDIPHREATVQRVVNANGLVVAVDSVEAQCNTGYLVGSRGGATITVGSHLLCHWEAR